MLKKARNDKIKEYLHLPFSSMVINYDYYFYGELDKTLPFSGLTIVRIISNDKIAISNNYNELFIVDLISNSTEFIGYHNKKIKDIIILSDGSLVTASKDTFIKVWSQDSKGKWYEKYTLEGHNYGVKCLAILPQNKIVSGSYDHTIRIWNNGIEEDIIENDGDCVLDIEILPNGNIVSCDMNNFIKIWMYDGDTWILDQVLRGHDLYIKYLDVFPDGRIVSGSADGTFIIWKDGEIQSRVTCGIMNRITILPDDSIAVGNLDENEISIWKQDKKYKILDTNKEKVISLKVLPDGRLLGATFDGLIQIWR